MTYVFETERFGRGVVSKDEWGETVTSVFPGDVFRFRGYGVAFEVLTVGDTETIETEAGPVDAVRLTVRETELR